MDNHVTEEMNFLLQENWKILLVTGKLAMAIDAFLRLGDVIQCALIIPLIIPFTLFITFCIFMLYLS